MPTSAWSGQCLPSQPSDRQQVPFSTSQHCQGPATTPSTYDFQLACVLACTLKQDRRVNVSNKKNAKTSCCEIPDLCQGQQVPRPTRSKPTIDCVLNLRHSDVARPQTVPHGDQVGLGCIKWLSRIGESMIPDVERMQLISGCGVWMLAVSMGSLDIMLAKII